MAEYRWKFLRAGLKSKHRNLAWEVGKWKKYKGKLNMCHSGFHCSKEIHQAFSYVQGEILAKVEVKGKCESRGDKDVWSDMKIVEAYKWQKKDSVALSIYSAELCIKNFEKVYPNDDRPRKAIEAAKKWLKNPTEENRSAANYAANSAEWSAGWSAADSAARSAARSAAGSEEAASWSVEWAARSAGAVVIKKISNWMDERVKKLAKYN